MSAALRRLIPQSVRGRWRGPGGYLDVLILAGPLVLSTGTTTVQQFINRMFLSWYSADAMAASLPAGAISFTFICFFIGLASYANTFVAQFHGARQPERIAASMWQAIYLSLAASVVIIPFAFAAEPMFRLAGHESGIRELEVSYFRILVLGGGAPILSSALCSFFTGRGLTRTVMAVNIGTAVLNCVLDYLLIFGNLGFPEWGIAGAAWASVISSAASALWLLGLFLFGSHRHEYRVWQSRGLDRDLFARLVRYGAPSGLHYMLDLLSWSLFIMLVGRLGAVELGASSLAFQVNSIVFTPMIGFSVATATLVGQRIGEERPDLAARSAWSAFHLTFAYMCFFSALYVLTPVLFLAPFGAKADPAQFPALRDMAVIMLRFVAIYSIFDGANLVFSAALKGAGDTVYVMVVTTILGFGLMVVPTWLICASPHGTVWGAWTSLTVYVCLAAFFFIGRFLQGKWRSMRVTEGLHVPLSGSAALLDAPVTEAPITDC